MKKLLFLCLFSWTLNAQQIERIEPETWWVGMKNPSLQVLVHGEDISITQPVLKYKGVKLKKINKVENPNYLFLDLEISKTAKPGDIYIEFISKQGKKLSKSIKLLEREPNSAQRQGFNTSDVIYLITPDRFANGDVNNDNTLYTKEKSNRSNYNGRHGGDIKGISDHLDYIKDMGFTTLWSMPLLENNLKEVTYHGYSITDYYKIDPRYGDNEQFVAMVKKSNKIGLKWIMDVIPNHCGIDHWWMSDLPTKDWINNGGVFKSTTHRREVNQDIHASEKDKKDMVEGWFVPTMPDLNQRNPYLAKYLTQNTIWWIEYAGLSGLRVDTYPYSEKKFLTDWMKAILDEYPNLNAVGEEWTVNANTIAYWQKGAENRDGYKTYIPSMMDFPLQFALSLGLTETEGYSSGLARIYSSISNDYLYPNPNNLVIFGDNHDMSRFFTQVKEDPKLFKMGLAILATMRGIPQIYYGTEIGIANRNSEEHGIIRADMPGGWVGDSKNAFTGQNLSDQERNLQDFTKKLLNWRKSATAIHDGKLMHHLPEEGVYSYFRYTGHHKVWVIINKNDKEVEINFNKYPEMLTIDDMVQDVLDKSDWTNSVKVPSKSFRILEVNIKK